MKQPLYEIYDQQGKDRGFIQAISPADATRKAREYICAFPIVTKVEVERDK